MIIIGAILLAGCAGWSTSPPGSRPYFSPDPKEVKVLQVLARKQESVASKCGETNSCDQVYFTQGLLGLYESREVAEKYFGKVLIVAPKSQLAVSSKAWLDLLRQPTASGNRSWVEAVFQAPALAEANTSWALAADRLVRDLLDREVLIQHLRESKDDESETVEALQRELTDRDHKIEALLSRKDSAKLSTDPTSIQSIQNMQKQLAERDRKIEELSTQLEALKRIDQEMREKVRPIRPPLTTVPVPGPETTP